MDGWIKIYRDLLKWEWFGKAEMVQIFVWLLLRANHEDKMCRGRLVRRGQLIATKPQICGETKLTEQQVKTCLGRLKSTGEITVETTNKYSVITVCNFERYQGRLDERPTNNRQTDSQNNRQVNRQNQDIIGCDIDCYQDQEENINRQNNRQNNRQTLRQSTDSTTNIITNITRKKEIKNSSSSSARAREEGFISQLKTEQAWLEAMAMNFRVSAGEVCGYLDQFLTDTECRATEHRSITDARRHFNDWLRIRLSDAARGRRAKENKNNKNINDLWR